MRPQKRLQVWMPAIMILVVATTTNPKVITMTLFKPGKMMVAVNGIFAYWAGVFLHIAPNAELKGEPRSGESSERSERL